MKRFRQCFKIDLLFHCEWPVHFYADFFFAIELALSKRGLYIRMLEKPDSREVHAKRSGFRAAEANLFS